MTRKPSAALELISALGALGRRFDPVAPTLKNQVILASYPDSLFYYENPSAAKADKLRTN